MRMSFRCSPLTIMRKSLFIISALATALLLTGCQSATHTTRNTDKTINDEGKNSATATGHSTPLTIGEKYAGDIAPQVAAAISKQMDGMAAEIAALNHVKTESVTDVNGLKALRVVLSSDVSFETGKDVLRPGARTLLHRLAQVLVAHPEVYLMVYGHTDNVGTMEANRQLSCEQASAVVHTLIPQGVDKSRITTFEGRHFADPVASNNTAEGRAENRRVEIYLYAGEKMIETARQ